MLRKIFDNKQPFIHIFLPPKRVIHKITMLHQNTSVDDAVKLFGKMHNGMAYFQFLLYNFVRKMTKIDF